MTRRELREHCFKMLFGTAFYPIEEADDQISHYFEAPDEDEQQEDGSYRVIHSAAFDIYDSDYVRGKVEKIIEKIPELDQLRRRHSGEGRHQRGGGTGQEVWRGRFAGICKRDSGKTGVADGKRIFCFTGQHLYKEYVCPGLRS